MCQHILGIKPATEKDKPAPRTPHADKWALNLAAATQYYQREGHLHVPRKHVETVTVESADSRSPEQRDINLGAWISNQRSRTATLTPQRIEQLSAIGMRWA